tara:strand:- start:327 stop:725 length:399 start_codon:yes stop_codon:yes gene_type:complete
MKAMTCLILLLLLQGCAGTRHSYSSMVEEENNVAVLRVQKGDVVELLAIGNGFPGWWGYFPGVISSAPDIASIDCKQARSAVPFREPGVVFGGVVCSLTAHKTGKTTLYFGNEFTLSQSNHDEKIEAIVVDN